MEGGSGNSKFARKSPLEEVIHLSGLKNQRTQVLDSLGMTPENAKGLTLDELRKILLEFLETTHQEMIQNDLEDKKYNDETFKH